MYMINVLIGFGTRHLPYVTVSYMLNLIIQSNFTFSSFLEISLLVDRSLSMGNECLQFTSNMKNDK